MMKKSVNEIIEDQCCGCGACFQVCPQKCISMVQNERGFLMPSVQQNLCIGCGACVRVCPEQNTPSGYEVQQAWAAITKKLEIQKKSTSGGVFSVIAESVLELNGVVFGAAWNNKNCVEHIQVDTSEKLDQIRQSKYVQSNIGNTYQQAENALKNGQHVLFSGTACQIAGLRNYLKKEYSNLITVEVACHGVPSPGLFQKYVAWREQQQGEKLIEYRFRNRDKHETGEHFMACARFKGGVKRYYPIETDPYYDGFMTGKTLRKTCYHCRYKGWQRAADITLSDFWGIEKELKRFPAQHGVSAVLLNTSKAVAMFESLKNHMITVACEPQSVFAHNTSMLQSCSTPEKLRLQTICQQEAVLFAGLSGKLTLKKRLKMWLKRIMPTYVRYVVKRWLV